MKVNFNRIIKTLKEVIFEPIRFWEQQKESKSIDKQSFTGYFLPLLVVIFLAIFVSELIRGSRFYLTFPLMKAGREILLFLFHYVFSVFLTNELIKTFGGIKNIFIARKLVVYSLTPFLLVSLITGMFPFLYVMDALGLYGFFIFWVGVKALLVFPERKQISYILVTTMANFFVFSFLSIFLSKLLTAFL
ncbi:YIP1 family protein [Mariniphaga sp.]|uniref:YIP1 family protein n=1 Tax=Mariniphaga sp. TaxID=1954475 RepID=UPI0035676CA3